MVDKSYFPELLIEGQNIDLAHLEPFTFVMHSEKAKRDLRVHVTFSTHCFSISYLQENHPAGQPVIDAASARPRTFCPVRYRLSHRLPALIQSLNHPKAKVWETATERNWCYSITIDDPKGPYHVFFEVRRATGERQQWQDLQLVVESAYHEADGGGPKLKGSMAFPLLCGKIYLREPTATKR